jgi:uncharacterized protein YwqG
MSMNIIQITVVVILTTIYFMVVKKKANTKSIEQKARHSPTAPPNITTREDWELKFKEAGLEHHWAKFQTLLRDEIIVSYAETNESSIKIGTSKIGGRPDLPVDQSWFQDDNGKSLSFLAQINFKETKPFDKSNQLPYTGIVYFFYSAEQGAWGYDPDDKHKFKVFYFDGETSRLRRHDFPNDVADQSRFKPCQLEFLSSTTLPGWESDEVKGVFTEDELDAYIELSEGGEITKLLGYSDNIQGPMEEECQLVTNGLFCGDSSGRNDPRTKELEKDSHQWRLLFQIDSIEKAGMMWGDGGRIYFWIKVDDLIARRFEQSWFALQCY